MENAVTRKPVFYGWWLLAACWLIVFFCQAFPNYGSPVMNSFMAKEFKASRESMGGMFSVYLALGGVPGVVAGMFMAKTGSKPLLVSGAIALMIGSVLMAFWVQDISQAFWGFSVFIGYAHFAGGFLGTQYALAHWFKKRRAMAMSILYSAAGFGGMIAPQILNFVIEKNNADWRAGWWVLFFAGIFTTILTIFFVKDKPEEMGQFVDGDPNPEVVATLEDEDHNDFRTKQEWSLKKTASTFAYWATLLGFAAPSSAFATYLAHGVLHLRDQGFSPGIAATAISVTSIASLSAKIIVGALGDRFDPRYIWILFLCSTAYGMFALSHAHDNVTMSIAVACLGAGFGGMLVCMVTVWPNYFGVKVFPILSGISLTLQGSAIALVPLIVGKIYDSTGTYVYSFYALGGFCAVMAVVLLFVRRPVYKA